MDLTEAARNGELDAAQQQCNLLIETSADSTQAVMLHADLLLSKSEFETAVYQFEQVLDKDPANFAAIAKCITLLRRAGRPALHWAGGEGSLRLRRLASSGVAPGHLGSMRRYGLTTP